MTERYIICKGDKTTHGGTVLDGMAEWSIEGVPVACLGHLVSCPQCKGNYPIIEGSSKATVMGKQIALEGMKTACGAALISSQTLSSVDDESWSGFQSRAVSAPVIPQHLGAEDVPSNHYAATS